MCKLPVLAALSSIVQLVIMERTAMISLFYCAAMLMLVCGKECRENPSVVKSAQSVSANSAEGGHIWQHVHGLSSRPKGAQKSETQLDKTLFASEDDYKAAWKKFQDGKFDKLKQCMGKPKGQMVDCVPASKVGVKTAYRCTEVEKNTKICTNKKEVKPIYVEFWYAQKGGKWVLNTAYPSVKGDSAPSCPAVSKDIKEEKKYAILKLLKLLRLLE